jgi:sec-independent protein translocase protein TatB
VFDLSITKLLVLAVLAIVIFGPEQLPRIASQAARALRDLRRLAEGARNDLREGLGPEFADFDVTDLHPKNFVRKHLLEGLDDGAEPEDIPPAHIGASADGPGDLAPGEAPPYDSEAT